MKISLKSYIQLSLLVIFFLFYALFFAQKINLVTADLGRHIKNGEVFFQTWKPISTNFYSYTQPTYPTVNHHWGTGVIFYLVWKLSGFNGLSLFHIFINSLAFMLFFIVAQKKSNFTIALFCSFLSIPLIAGRTEIRPEGFSYLFLGIYYFVLSQYSEKNLQSKWIWIIPGIQIFWVNIHLFFFMGVFVVGAFMVDALINKKATLPTLVSLFITTILVCLINPFGLVGALTPLTIFKEYGYRLVENQTIVFMQTSFSNPVYVHFEILFGIMVIFFISLCIEKRIRSFLVSLLLIAFFSILTWKANRALPLFGLFVIPIGAEIIYLYLKNYSRQVWRQIDIIFIGLVMMGMVIGLLPGHYYSPFRSQYGLGLENGINNSAIFFKKNDIKGPIFNNYDIGGYLIYHLFPQEKVFVDNRPEAYTVPFFTQEYIPMQSDNKLWEKFESKYQFNAIYFNRNDYTPWGQYFLIQRVQDKEWAPVFVDDYTIIFLKRNKQNEKIIQQSELSKEMFTVR